MTGVEHLARTLCIALGGGDPDAINGPNSLKGPEGSPGWMAFRKTAQVVLLSLDDLVDELVDTPEYDDGQFSRKNIDAFVRAALHDGAAWESQIKDGRFVGWLLKRIS